MASNKSTSSSLLQFFKSIDASFIFYYATSNSNVMSFKNLKSRVAHQSRLTLQLIHLRQIKGLYPDSYVIDTNFTNPEDYLISAPMVVSNSKLRLMKFEELLAKSNGITTSSVTPLANLSSSKVNIKRPASERLESLRKKPSSSILTNSLNKKNAVPKTSYANLLEKIRAKQKINQLTPKLSEEEKHQNFITGQLENVSAVLLSISRESSTPQLTNSYSLQYLATKLKDSLRCRLSNKEAEDAILSLASKLPQFCSVVQVGNVRAVKIYHDTNLGDIRLQLACPPV